MANIIADTARDIRFVLLRSIANLPIPRHHGARACYGRLYHGGITGLGKTITSNVRINVRREPGDWVRTQIQSSITAVVALLSAILGLTAGVGLAACVGWRIASLAVLCLAGTAVFGVRCYERGGFGHLLKGAAAEKNLGGSMEFAITAPGCAIAHSVTKIAKIGDIDHLVATPGILWVVETKFRNVPKDHFAEVLRRISVNVQAVQRWSPPGTIVRGCLVLATGKPRKRLYEEGLVEILDRKSLVRKLKHESTSPASTKDLLVAKRVWCLACEELIQAESGLNTAAHA